MLCILSKLWYVLHIYPLTGLHAIDINRILFRYLWCGRYEPIRRTTMFKPKCIGVIDLINCQLKSKVLLANSSLKCYISEEYQNSLMVYYCYLRMNNTIEKNFSVHDAAIISPPYYQIMLNTIDTFLNVSTFPILSKKKMYESMLPNEQPLVEYLYPHFNWRTIWSNFCDIRTDPFDKDIIFKHLHISLATRSRLAMFNIANNSTCNLCNDEKEQTALHMFYECTYIAPFYQWFLNILIQVCNFKPLSNIRFLYFDSFYLNVYQKRICNLFLAVYITTVWRTRKENLRIGNLKVLFIKKATYDIRTRKEILGKTREEIYGQYFTRLTDEELNKL